MRSTFSSKISSGLLLILLAACSNAPFPTEPPPSATPVPSPTPDPGECAIGSTPTFDDYITWKKINSNPIHGHEVYVDIYVNDLAEATYLAAAGGTFPVCAKIVKTHLLGPDSQMITAVTVMVKMEPGYDPVHNDWWWGMYAADGQTAEMIGQVQVCIACHMPAAAADYVFSQTVLTQSQNP